MAKRLWLAFLLTALLAACSASPTATPTVPTIPTVHVSPFALPLARSLAEPYINQRGALPFDLVPMGSPDAFEAVSQAEAVLHIDYPPVPDDWFATPLGWEGIAIIVHPEVPIRSLTVAELADIYAGRVDDWQILSRGQGPIQPVLPPRGDSMRSIFTQLVLPEGQVTTLARLSPTPAEALRIVQDTEGAIGLLPGRQNIENSGVSLIRIEGHLPITEEIIEGDYPLRAQIIASAPTEPEGPVRDWLAWIQGQDPEPP